MIQNLLFFFIAALLLTSPFTYAESTLTSEQEKQMELVLDRFEEINDILSSDHNLSPKEEAKLYYEKAMIMFTHFRFLRTPTVCLLRAVKLYPDNKKYKDLLCDMYNEVWKNMDLSGKDEISAELKKIQIEVKKVVGGR